MKIQKKKFSLDSTSTMVYDQNWRLDGKKLAGNASKNKIAAFVYDILHIWTSNHIHYKTSIWFIKKII